MPLTRDHLDRAVLRGDNRFKAWKEKFDRQWNFNQTQVQLGLFWQRLPPIVKQQLQQRDPAAVKEMERKFGRRQHAR